MTRLEIPQTYRAAYARGYATSASPTEGSLERADDRGESNAWYDGYSDYACGRGKWHTPLCTENGYCDIEHPAADLGVNKVCGKDWRQCQSLDTHYHVEAGK